MTVTVCTYTSNVLFRRGGIRKETVKAWIDNTGIVKSLQSNLAANTLADISLGAFDEIFQHLTISQKDSMYVMDQEGRILYCSKRERIGQLFQASDSEEYHAFEGTGIQLYGAKDPGHGIAEVIIDEGTANAISTNVDYYGSSRQDNVKLFENLSLSSCSHTLKVRVTGTKNASSSSTYITADRVKIFSKLLVNSGFESGSLSPWLGQWNPALAGVETNYPKSGTYDAYLHPTTSADVAIYQIITAPSTRTYTLTANAATNITTGVQLGVDVNGMQAGTSAVSGSSYGLYTISFSATAGQTIKIWYYSSKKNGWATLDQVNLY
jgi:hypothetical protein